MKISNSLFVNNNDISTYVITMDLTTELEKFINVLKFTSLKQLQVGSVVTSLIGGQIFKGFIEESENNNNIYTYIAKSYTALLDEPYQDNQDIVLDINKTYYELIDSLIKTYNINIKTDINNFKIDYPYIFENTTPLKMLQELVTQIGGVGYIEADTLYITTYSNISKTYKKIELEDIIGSYIPKPKIKQQIGFSYIDIYMPPFYTNKTNRKIEPTSKGEINTEVLAFLDINKTNLTAFWYVAPEAQFKNIEGVQKNITTEKREDTISGNYTGDKIIDINKPFESLSITFYNGLKLNFTKNSTGIIPIPDYIEPQSYIANVTTIYKKAQIETEETEEGVTYNVKLFYADKVIEKTGGIKTDETQKEINTNKASNTEDFKNCNNIKLYSKEDNYLIFKIIAPVGENLKNYINITKTYQSGQTEYLKAVKVDIQQEIREVEEKLQPTGKDNIKYFNITNKDIVIQNILDNNIPISYKVIGNIVEVRTNSEVITVLYKALSGFIRVKIDRDAFNTPLLKAVTFWGNKGCSPINIKIPNNKLLDNSNCMIGEIFPVAVHKQLKTDINKVINKSITIKYPNGNTSTRNVDYMGNVYIEGVEGITEIITDNIIPKTKIIITITNN